MKFSYTLIPVAVAMTVAGHPAKRDVDPSLIPPFGFQSGVNPTGTGVCDGAVNGADGKPIKVPCDCPPDRTFFIQQLNANVAAGHAVNNPTVPVSFPTDDSVASQLERLNTAAVTLQNLEGPGVGCPITSTTFAAQQAAILAGEGAPLPPPPPTSVTPTPTPPATSAPASVPPSSAPPAQSSPASGSGQLTDAQVAAVAPPLGWESGINPTGTGTCDGAVKDSDENPIKIPCDCPPAEDDFIEQLTANANAGEAIHNPTVKISFPLDNSTDSQLVRLNAAAVTLQNMNGPGVGCPVESTTFSTQQQAIQDGTPLPPSAGGPSSSSVEKATSTSAPAPPAAPSDPALTAKTSASAPTAKTSAPAPPAMTPAPTPHTTTSVATPPAKTSSDPVRGGGGSSGSSTSAQDAAVAALVPDLGFTAGVNPKGNGNCDGAVEGSDGEPVQVPCFCPPDRDTFTRAVIGNVDAGHAVHNPSVGVSFPLDNSTSALVARLQASIVTLQNLNGSGQGCPVQSTTLSAQLSAALA